MNVTKGYKTNISKFSASFIKVTSFVCRPINVLLFQKLFHESHKECRSEGAETKGAAIDEEKLWHCYFWSFVLLNDDKRWRIVLKISGARHHHKPTVYDLSFMWSVVSTCLWHNLNFIVMICVQ